MSEEGARHVFEDQAAVLNSHILKVGRDLVSCRPTSETTPVNWACMLHKLAFIHAMRDITLTTAPPRVFLENALVWSIVARSAGRRCVGRPRFPGAFYDMRKSIKRSK